MKAKIVLDETQHGKPHSVPWKYVFYSKNKQGLHPITTCHEKVLIAVSKGQLQNWQKQNLVVKRRISVKIYSLIKKVRRNT